MDDQLFGAHHLLPQAGSDIHYWLTGRRQSQMVVLTHGGWMDHRMFAAQVTALHDQYQVLTWDMRGHGLSQPWRGELTYRSAAQDLKHILDQLSVERAMLIGQSMGAAIVQEFAFCYPDRVQGLVLIAGTNIMTPRPRSAQLRLSLILQIGRLLPRSLLHQNAWKLMRAMTVKPEVQAYMKEALAQVTKSTYLAIGRAVLQGFHTEPAYHLARPCLLLCGEFDRASLHQDNAAWAAREPCCQYAIVPQAGHNANQDNPEFVNARLIEFLKQEIKWNAAEERPAILLPALKE